MKRQVILAILVGGILGLGSGGPGFGAGGGGGSATAQEIVEPQPQRISQFSGKPVPRFEMLRYSEVNGRAGPSLDHPVRWQYQREGLPLLIVKESQDWRQVRDPDGEEVWMLARMLRKGKTGMTLRNVKMYQTASATSQPIAQLEADVMVTVIEPQGEWVRVKVDDHRGWVPLSAIWGVQPPASGP